ncbi:SDR family oxidoreductase [Specibacter sp. RAF43]|uniref:SDR family oxidoreductase n=1 Tax=Specibacter sp. RAF43 TaxID=3233057 RepID=UPI003F9E4DC6
MSSRKLTAVGTIAVAGATGYLGGRLVPLLLENGEDVRVLSRRREKLRDVPWRAQVEILEGSMEDPETARALCEGADVVYFLVHSMSGGKSAATFEKLERACALNLAKASREAGVRRLVYLSGLHPPGKLSRHLASRTEVGEILLASGTPTAVLQAGLVIGSGSASFEMVRHLTDVLPLMPAPKWVMNKIQPIAIRDALHYLVGAARLPADINRTFDIGGPEVLTYADMMGGYAHEAGFRRPLVIPLPVLTPWLAAQWVSLVTPVPRSLAVPLVESLQHDCVAAEKDIAAYIPDPAGGLTPYGRAVQLALHKIAADTVETTWATAHALSAPAEPLPSDPEWAGLTVFTDERTKTTTAPAERVWSVVEGIGGANGYYSLPFAWAARGWLDKAAGGVGLSRGRRSHQHLQLNDAVDWWRVEALERGRLLRLRAEMIVPGRAWLEFEVTPVASAPGTEGGSVFRQRAIFFPRGLSGRLYWLAVLPFHGIIFKNMANRITAAAGLPPPASRPRAADPQ